MATKDYSTKQEQMVADFLEWDTVSASGARQFDKGDIISDDWLGECKTHEELVTDIVFYKEFWSKLVEQADSSYHHPVLVVDDGSQRIDNTWVLFRYLDVTDDCKSDKLPGQIYKNIRFSNSFMKEHFEQDKDFYDSDKFVYYTDKFGEKLAVCPLKMFAEIIGYYK